MAERAAVTRTAAPVSDPIASIRELFDARSETINARFDGMDKAVAILQSIADRQPTASVLQERITALRVELLQMFVTDSVKFVELDKRTEALTAAGKIAIDAAFKAQQEAASKQEAQFTKLIDQTRELMQTSMSGMQNQINDLKSRLDKGEGAGHGRDAQVLVTNRGEDRTTQYVAFAFSGIMALIAIGTLAIALTK